MKCHSQSIDSGSDIYVLGHKSQIYILVIYSLSSSAVYVLEMRRKYGFWFEYLYFWDIGLEYSSDVYILENIQSSSAVYILGNKEEI